jgi:hypothetical protein
MYPLVSELVSVEGKNNWTKGSKKLSFHCCIGAKMCHGKGNNKMDSRKKDTKDVRVKFI